MPGIELRSAAFKANKCPPHCAVAPSCLGLCEAKGLHVGALTRRILAPTFHQSVHLITSAHVPLNTTCVLPPGVPRPSLPTKEQDSLSRHQALSRTPQERLHGSLGGVPWSCAVSTALPGQAGEKHQLGPAPHTALSHLRIAFPSSTSASSCAAPLEGSTG